MSGQETALLVFDTETTGLCKGQDQVIELAVQAGLTPSAPRHTWRFRPSVPIDPEAQKVHGISAEDLAGERPFSFYAARLHRMFTRADVLIGYNVGFDLDMVQAEFERAGLPAVDLREKRIVDAYRLWASMEPRKLQDAHRRFVGAEFDGAHQAQADVAATAAVLRGMIGAFGLQEADWATLAERCGPIAKPRHIEHRDGIPVLAFGKHAGRSLSEIAAGPDRGYLDWMLKGDFPENVKHVCRTALQQAA
jgi:DNA polymerase-3 subunit epsilon